MSYDLELVVWEHQGPTVCCPPALGPVELAVWSMLWALCWVLAVGVVLGGGFFGWYVCEHVPMQVADQGLDDDGLR